MIIGKLRIAFDELLREKDSGGNILLEGVALLLIGVIIFFQALNNYNENETDKILKYGIKNTGEVEVNSFDNLEELEKFENEIGNVLGIEQAGSYIAGSVSTDFFNHSGFEDIYEIQKKHLDMNTDWEEAIGKYIESITITQGSEKLFNLEVSEGYSFEECENLLEEYDIVIYLGSKIKELEIGTVIDTLNDPDRKKAIIGGYIKPGLRMVKENISDESVAYIETDYQVLSVCKDEFRNRGDMIFAVSKDSDMNIVKEELYQLAKTYKVDMTVKTYKGIFEGIANSKQVFINFLGRIWFVVLITVIILQICMQSVHIIENFKNYGIMYANGFSAADQLFIFSVQSAIKGVIAMFLALGAGYFLLDGFYSDEVYSLDVLYDVLFCYVLWKVVLCAVVIAVFSVVISVVVFRRKTPKELIQES